MPEKQETATITGRTGNPELSGVFGGSRSPLTPWHHGQGEYAEALKELLSFDSLVLGVIDSRSPRCDALLAAHGIETETLVQWCDSGYRKDESLREARRKGMALGHLAKGEPGPPLAAGQYLMVHMLPVSLSDGRTWYMALGRSGSEFDEQEQQLAAFAVRSLAASFDYIGEPGLGRLLLGEDGRMIHADPATEALILNEQGYIEELAATLPPLVAQRWPELADRIPHSIALTLAGRPHWIRFQRARADGDSSGGMVNKHWYVELRPLESDDIPAVGVLEDDRVAQAVAYLSDYYAQAPSLNDVAEAVETSPFHFHRLFVRHVGRSPKHYLLRMQLMVAKWLLRATRTPIGEIATATGFASHGHFTATFHRMVGQSPSQYRETA